MSVSPEINKNSFRKYVFDIEHNCEVINYQIDAEFQELFDQFSSETDIAEYMVLTLNLLHRYHQLIHWW